MRRASTRTPPASDVDHSTTVNDPDDASPSPPPHVQRLLEMLPDARVFLDVDDLRMGRGTEYLDVSVVVLVLCSRGYFGSTYPTYPTYPT